MKPDPTCRLNPHPNFSNFRICIPVLKEALKLAFHGLYDNVRYDRYNVEVEIVEQILLTPFIGCLCRAGIVWVGFFLPTMAYILYCGKNKQ